MWHESQAVQEKLSARQAKRAAKAAERRRKSDALKEEGNTFFRNGDFHNALHQYQRAIDVHGPSQKPILLANLAAVYLQLGMYFEAHETADKALTADPTSIKARYRRGMARKHLKMWTGAYIDFSTVLTLDPGNEIAQAELATVEERQSDPDYPEEDEVGMDSYSDYESPALDDDPAPGDSLSESSDCEHKGNAIPCKFYNRTECKNGRDCRFSHAPDEKSVRDALGRNVCRYYLLDLCKFGERCSYLHSREYLLHKGWWSTPERIERERKLQQSIQMWNKSIARYKNQFEASAADQTPKKNTSKGKKRGGRRTRPKLDESFRSGSAARAPSAPMVGQSSRGPGTRNRKKHAVYAPSVRDGYNSDEDDENGLAMCGFTGSEVEELICQGVKPWDDDAWDVLHALHDHYDHY